MIPFFFHYITICPNCGKENRIKNGETVGYCKRCKQKFIAADVPFRKN